MYHAHKGSRLPASLRMEAEKKYLETNSQTKWRKQEANPQYAKECSAAVRKVALTAKGTESMCCNTRWKLLTNEFNYQKCLASRFVHFSLLVKLSSTQLRSLTNSLWIGNSFCFSITSDENLFRLKWKREQTVRMLTHIDGRATRWKGMLYKDLGTISLYMWTNEFPHPNLALIGFTHE